ncbi:putative N-acetyltransferase [Diplonema papillatum]|nr:putative N-acetyltransferase [Diplonema papillatum]
MVSEEAMPAGGLPEAGPTVSKMTKEDSKSEVVAVMTSAFEEDPVMRQVWRKRDKYAGCLRAFFEAMIDHHMEDAYLLRTPTGDIAGVAIYENKKHWFLKEELAVARKEIRYSGWKSFFSTIWAFGFIVGPILVGFQSKYCKKGTVYLKLLAVASKHHGKGFGTLLLSTTLELEADQKGRKTYLESSNERNLSLYKRHGFVQQDEVPVRKSPLFPMVREVHASRSGVVALPRAKTQTSVPTWGGGAAIGGKISHTAP